MSITTPCIDIVIPAYRVRAQVCAVVEQCLAFRFIRRVHLIDDGCPESCGTLVQNTFAGDARVQVLFNGTNRGVGGAVLHGYERAFGDGADIAIKVDGDGQTPLSHLSALLAPLIRGEADYAKGNRFFHPRDLARMPAVRLFGNAALSLVNKLCSGYWSVMDPTNGFTALHRSAWQVLPRERLARDYFFESDLLYQLGIVRAVVADVPAPVIYGEETSSLSIGRTLVQFPARYAQRFIKRFVYLYLIRDFSLASIETLFGLPLLVGGLAFGAATWARNAAQGALTPPGTVMITGLLILIGFQLLLSAINYDIAHEPSRPLQGMSGTDPIF